MSTDVMTNPTESFPVGRASNKNIVDFVEEIDSSSIPQLKIDPEIKQLCRPLGDEERRLLENDIKKHGCRDPIVYWEGNGTIIDGHNRHEICTMNGIPYKRVSMCFETKEDVMNYVIDHQLGRRNLSELEKSYLRGKRYLTEKKAPHRPSGSELPQSEVVPGETAGRIAKQNNVSSATIERDANLAEALDKIRDVIGDEFVNNLRSGTTKLSKKGIGELSKQPPEDMKVLAEHMKSGAKLPEARARLESRKSTQPEPNNVSPPLPKKDKSIEKVERHLGHVIEILEKMDDSLVEENLSELLATTQKIQDMLKAIGAKIPDSVQLDVNGIPDIADVEILAGSQKHNSDYEAPSDVLNDEDAELFKECIVDDQKPYPGLPDGWGGYQKAIDSENENQEDMCAEV